MRFTKVVLENWRNFIKVGVPLEQRVFLVGPNAVGKSNFLDAFRFLRDVADSEGGLTRAVHDPRRKSVSQIRSLYARRNPNVVIEVDVAIQGKTWNYRLEFGQDNQRRPLVKREFVCSQGKVILERPDRDDVEDPSRLTQTHLEQVSANRHFRELADFFAQIRYLHLVPQLVREPERSMGKRRDPLGGDFLEQLAVTPTTTRDSRLRRIREALQVAVPQLKDLKLERDQRGVPHLKGFYEHWRPNAGWQTEEQFSDGTLRLLGLLWILLDGKHPLLLEEPELSLHAEIVRRIPQMMARLGRKTGRQVLVSTHSPDLLLDEGIGPEEVLLLSPASEGTQVKSGAEYPQIVELLEGGVPMADAILPLAAPSRVDQLRLFGS